MLVPFPIACFTGALLTDLAYWGSAELFWANFSVWLITAGLFMAGLAALMGLIDYFADRRIRAIGSATVHMLLGLTLFVVEFVNVLVHSRDGWTAVVPTGLILSATSVVLMAVGAWLGSGLVYRHGVGVTR